MAELVAMQEHDRVERARRSGQMTSIRSRRLASQGAMPGDGGKWDTDHDVGDDDILYGDSIRENDARENDSQRQRWLRRLRVNARGRDFTVNGMMYDVRTGDLYDFCGGLDDVEGKCVRTINRADEAFAADPTLMLRAIRVAARHGLQPTREILAATRAHAPAIRTASAMRVVGASSHFEYGPAAGACGAFRAQSCKRNAIAKAQKHAREEQQPIPHAPAPQRGRR